MRFLTASTPPVGIRKILAFWANCSIAFHLSHSAVMLFGGCVWPPSGFPLLAWIRRLRVLREGDQQNGGGRVVFSQPFWMGVAGVDPRSVAGELREGCRWGPGEGGILFGSAPVPPSESEVDSQEGTIGEREVSLSCYQVLPVLHSYDCCRYA